MARLSKSEKLKREQRLREMGGILLFGLAFLALAIIFLPSGLTGHLGGVLKQGFFGLFGSISYFLPLLFIYLALELLLAKELILSRKRQVLSLFLLLTIMCLIAVFSLNEDSLIYHALKDGQVKASEVLKALWRAPAAEQIANYKSFWNGGFFASVISLGLMNLLGKVGAVLFLLIALLVIMLFLFNFSYVYFVKSGYVSLKEKREAFLRAREESRAESLARAEFESEQENLEAPEANNFSNPEAEGYLAEADLINSRSDELSGWDSSSELSKHQIKNQYLDP
ncbi:MAG: hypothetical protein Q4P08_05580, partial [Eubacteriales bacterium]|nr:hypothetical protein [Eubacteriales bacterium]